MKSHSFIEIEVLHKQHKVLHKQDKTPIFIYRFVPYFDSSDMHPFIHPFIHPLVSPYDPQFTHPSIHPSICPSIDQSLFALIHSPTYHPLIHPSHHHKSHLVSSAHPFALIHQSFTQVPLHTLLCYLPPLSTLLWVGSPWGHRTPYTIPHKCGFLPLAHHMSTIFTISPHLPDNTHTHTAFSFWDRDRCQAQVCWGIWSPLTISTLNQRHQREDREKWVSPPFCLLQRDTFSLLLTFLFIRVPKSKTSVKLLCWHVCMCISCIMRESE